MTDERGVQAREAAPRRCEGHMEREPGRLQLRLVLYQGEHVCEIDIEEDDETVVAFATVCRPVEDDNAKREGCGVPCHVYLELPLGDRAVRDGYFGHAIPYRNIYAELEAEARAREWREPRRAGGPAARGPGLPA